jgi:large subunit ribosomal protein L6
MSRIGRLPVVIPKGVTVDIGDGNVVTVKGPKGTLAKGMHKNMTIAVEDGRVIVSRPNDEKENRALHGLTRALVKNMVTGVTDGFQKGLDLVGVGYRAQVQGKKLVLTVGYSHPVEMEEIPGITYEAPAPNKIFVKGIDRELVGLVAARIRDVRKPEPYKGKGIKYENEVVRRKESNKGKK